VAQTRLTVVPNAAEADVLAGLLRTAGIPCEIRPTDAGAGGWSASAGGWVEVVVDESDLEAAQSLLAAPEDDEAEAPS
jgi:Putative prokaryotic signal transducing protein